MAKKSRKCLYRQTASPYRVVLLIIGDRIYKNMTYEQAAYCFNKYKNTEAILCTIYKDLQTDVKFFLPVTPDRDKLLLEMKDRLDRTLLKYYAVKFEIEKVQLTLL